MSESIVTGVFTLLGVAVGLAWSELVAIRRRQRDGRAAALRLLQDVQRAHTYVRLALSGSVSSAAIEFSFPAFRDHFAALAGVLSFSEIQELGGRLSAPELLEDHYQRFVRGEAGADQLLESWNANLLLTRRFLRARIQQRWWQRYSLRSSVRARYHEDRGAIEDFESIGISPLLSKP